LRRILRILDAVVIDSGYSSKKSFACCIQVTRSEASFGVAIATHLVEVQLSKAVIKKDGICLCIANNIYCDVESGL
jgi:hypothetical protein